MALTIKKIEIDQDLFTALLDACAHANDAVEAGFEDETTNQPYGYGPSEIKTTLTRPYSRAYEALAKAWDKGRSL